MVLFSKWLTTLVERGIQNRVSSWEVQGIPMVRRSHLLTTELCRLTKGFTFRLTFTFTNCLRDSKRFWLATVFVFRTLLWVPTQEKKWGIPWVNKYIIPHVLLLTFSGTKGKLGRSRGYFDELVLVWHYQSRLQYHFRRSSTLLSFWVVCLAYPEEMPEKRKDLQPLCQERSAGVPQEPGAQWPKCAEKLGSVSRPNDSTVLFL